MKTQSKEYQRIEQIKNYLDISLDTEFSRYLGLKNSQILSEIKRGKSKISTNLAVNICEKCPKIDYEWILTGKGAMLRDAANVVANNSDNTAATISVGNATTDSDRLLTLTESQQSTINKQTDTINRQSAIIGDLTASVCELAAKLAKLLPVLTVVALMGGSLAVSGCKKEVKCEWEKVRLKGDYDVFGTLGEANPFPDTYWHRYVCDGELRREIDFISGDTIYY